MTMCFERIASTDGTEDLPTGRSVLLGLLAAVIIVTIAALSLAGCGVNSQSSNSAGLNLTGGPSLLNTVTVQDNEYRVASRNPVGIVDGNGFSMAGENPMTAWSIDMGSNQMLNLGSAGNGELTVETENLATGHKTKAVGTWGGAAEIVAHAQVASALYETMKNLSLDEKAARIVQIEQAGQVSGGVLSLLRAMAGVP